MKEVLTSFDVAAMVHEVNELVKDAYISKIYQIGTKTLLFKLHKPNIPQIQLLIEAGKRIHLTSYVHQTPIKPSGFCMSLRKFIGNGVIKAVRQHEFERIVILDITTRKGDFQLVSELFGGGNIILVNSQDKILQAITYKRMRDRNILRGELFEHPPSRGLNPKKLEIAEFKKITDFNNIEIVRALTKFLSISGTYAEEILLRADINKKKKINTLNESEIDLIFNQLMNLLSLIELGKTKSQIIIDENNLWIDVTAIPLKKYEQFNKKSYQKFNDALDEYYAQFTDSEKLEELTGDVSSEVDRYNRILQRQKKALETLQEPIINNKKMGDLLYQHFGELQSLLQNILSMKRKGQDWTQIALSIEKIKKTNNYPEIYFHSLDAKNQILNVLVEEKIIPLDFQKSIQENADQYYFRSKKARKKLDGAKKTLEDTRMKIERAKKQVEVAKKSQKQLVKRKNKEWFEKFRWAHSSDGFLVIGGKDATSNEILIKKYMDPNDLVFHAEIVGAPFVLIKTEGKTPPKSTINEAAQLAASYSRAWKEMLRVINVYWIYPNQVSKTPPSGQSLKKGSFMIRGKKNFVRAVPLSIAVGLKIIDDQIMIIGGPVEAISNQTEVFVEIIPGDHKSSQLAKKIRHKLSTKVSDELKRSVTGITIDEIQAFIPLGRGKMKKG